MSELLDKIKKHKNKLLAAAALAAGAGGVHALHKYSQYRQNKQALRDDNILNIDKINKL